ncbi:TPA: hypothetical protein ACH3X1_006396 [Trebouxia sp. C0004]
MNGAISWYVDCRKLSRAVISTLQYGVVRHWPRRVSALDQLCSQEMLIIAHVPWSRFCEMPINARLGQDEELLQLAAADDCMQAAIPWRVWAAKFKCYSGSITVC